MHEEYPLEKLEKKIGYIFRDSTLLRQAMTHSSYANEQKILKQQNYERLEFLGDAVLELVSSESLFRMQPEMPEGKMTKMRSSCVCEQALAFCARDIELAKYMRLGKGEEATGGRERDSIIADMCEALIGAIYIDGGFANAKEFVSKFILEDMENKQLFYDSKTILQEIIQADSKDSLIYDLVKEDGPDHDKLFLVDARLGGEKIGTGQGRTKKAAEQQAAYSAILNIKKQKAK